MGSLLSILLAPVIYSLSVFTLFYVFYRWREEIFRILWSFKRILDLYSRKRRIAEKMREMREVAMHKKPSILGTVLTIGIFIGIVFILLFHVVFFTVVVSDSMFPTFKKGDLILMQSITTEPRVGDIITFKTDVYLYPVTHRVVSISDGKIRTKGDARDTVDSWVVSKEDVLAKAIHKSEENLSSYLVLETISTYESGTISYCSTSCK
ncbi:MAG: signal peptidase I [Candidatus Syntropharchaeia archaeon]